jgi:RNA polymerase sigma-70 factor (ECF subfamily)
MTKLPDTERQMIQRARKGDGTAFTWLVEAYQTTIYNLCYWTLGDADEAEDAAQETFLRAYTRLQSYDPAHSFKTWLCSVAHHYCIDRLRRRRFTWLSLEDETLIDHPALRASMPTPEETAIQHEQNQRVRATLDSLMPEYRSAVVMHYWYGLSYEEIAEATDASVSAVKSRLYRAREAMARQLTSQAESVLPRHEQHTQVQHLAKVI